MSSWLQRSALTHAAHTRQAAALGELETRALNAAVDALQKSIAFASGLPGGPDTTLDHLLLAEMRVLQRRYDEALALYEAHLPSAEGEGFLHEVTAAEADRGQCLIELGRREEGLAQLVAALKRVDESTPSDVRAIVHANLAAALKIMGRAAEAEQHRALAGMAWETYAHEQREARRLLAGDPSRPCTRSIAMAWEVVIGLETHAQLTTASKIFSAASTAFGAAPNSQASVIDVALPGTLPVLNRGAVERAIRFGLAIGATIAPRSIFARKNYFYPDLPKATRSASTRFRSCRVQPDLRRPAEGRRCLRQDDAADARAPGRRRWQIPARGLPRHVRHRPEPCRHTAAGDRVRA